MWQRFHLEQINLDPSIPLGRRGCQIGSSKNIETVDGWSDTPFNNIERSELHVLFKFLKVWGEEVFYVMRKASSSVEQTYSEKEIEIITKLREFHVQIDNTGSGQFEFKESVNEVGALFECFASLALMELRIQALREVKIKYPYKSQTYDPDGQKYDVVGGLDFSRLIWIECKKPRYDNEDNPLKNVLSKNHIQKFYQRAYYLKPTLAIYLVDTKEDYRALLKTKFSKDFLVSNNYFDSFSVADNVMARINGFIYFARIDYSSKTEYFEALKRAISQVLHDSRNEWPTLNYPGQVFRTE